MAEPLPPKPKSGALTGAIVLYIIATIITLLSVLGIVISGFLYTISFILSIVAIVQNRVAAGISMMIANLVTPFMILGIATVIGINTYSEVLEEAEQQGQAIIEKEQKAALDYVEFIDLYNVESGYRSFFNEPEPYVSFSLRNTGDSTLSEVEVTVYFKDKSGTVIYDDTFHPVLVTDWDFGDSKPLKPNYIVEDKTYSVDGLPQAWKEGSIDYEITDIDFYEED